MTITTKTFRLQSPFGSSNMNTFSKLALSWTAACAAMAVALASPAAAAQDQAIALKGDVMAVKTTTNEAGVTATQLVKPNLIVPGDRLLFTTNYHHTGEEAADNFVVTNPLPSAVRLAPDADPSLTVSVDGGTSWGMLAELTVADEAGASRAASHADVTHIRWTLPVVNPGDKGELQYPAIIR
jgi:hypothetical protein